MADYICRKRAKFNALCGTVNIPYGTEINFAFRPDLIHLFDPETEKNLMY